MGESNDAPRIRLEDLAALARGTSTCWLVHDARTKRLLWANPAACDVLGWTVEEMRPLTAKEMSSSAPNYQRVIGHSLLQKAVEVGVSRYEWHYRTRTGQIIPTESVATRVHLSGYDAILVEFRDIGKEAAVERELRRATSYLEAVNHRISVKALMMDPRGGIVYGTDAALEVLGVRAADADPELETYARLTADGRPVSWPDLVAGLEGVRAVELQVDAPEPVYLEGMVELLRDPDSDVYLLVLHDVSARVQEQRQRDRERHWENHLARYTAMGDIAMAIAHELGQPLAAATNFLAGSLTHLRRQPESGSSEAGRVEFGLQQALTQIERSRSIVSAVRAFVGHLEHVEQVVDLNDVIRECHYFVELRAEGTGIEVVLDLAPHPVPIRCERVLTGQVVLNLAYNALDELRECRRDADRTSPGRVVLASRVDEANGVFLVDDDGRGINRDPFAESFTSKVGGSGIGLALSYRIITRQHGRIWAERRPEGGSRFGFALPWVEGERPPPE